MKTISYRGGIVRFQIPDHWKEEYEPEGGGTFYDDRPDSGTLRLNVLSFGGNETPCEISIRRIEAKEDCEILPNGLPMKYRIEEAEEAGTPLTIYRWEICIPVPPYEFRTACFSYTIVAGQEEETEIRDELRLIDDLARAASFSQERGVSGYDLDACAEFEAELRRRGIVFEVDLESGRHGLNIEGERIFVSLDNLQLDLTRDGDSERVSRFIDGVIASASVSKSICTSGLFWCLEPNDYVDKAEFRISISERIDRVLVHVTPDMRLVTWVTTEMLSRIGVTLSEASEIAYQNLARTLGEASIEFEEIDGVKLGFIGSNIPFKTSLILAPNLRLTVEDILGWPLLAVTPHRGFLYLWDARHGDFAGRVGKVVVKEFSEASHSISTEVYEITDEGVCGIGEFPCPSRSSHTPKVSGT